ncbi:MAG: carboxypeptidase regulatory-like domain-containing protein [Blastocatellia bacterium]
MRCFWIGLAGSLLFAACSRAPQQSANAPAPSPMFQVDPKTVGTISGKILFTGKKLPGKKVNMDEDPQCAKLHPTPVSDDSLAANNNGTLANVFVYIKQGLEDKTFAPSSDTVLIDQKGCWFGPRVLGIQVGQTLKVTNSDPVSHNIHPLPQTNREWNQNQPPGAEAFTRKFTAPEVMIRVKCNIHAWMHAWIGVVAHPYFAVTGADGTFTLRNVPPGKYTLETWQEELGKQEQQITLAPSGQSEVTFTYK